MWLGELYTSRCSNKNSTPKVPLHTPLLLPLSFMIKSERLQVRRNRPVVFFFVIKIRNRSCQDLNSCCFILSTWWFTQLHRSSYGFTWAIRGRSQAWRRVESLFRQEDQVTLGHCQGRICQFISGKKKASHVVKSHLSQIPSYVLNHMVGLLQFVAKVALLGKVHEARSPQELLSLVQTNLGFIFFFFSLTTRCWSFTPIWMGNLLILTHLFRKIQMENPPPWV